jgi:hypothetical protein
VGLTYKGKKEAIEIVNEIIAVILISGEQAV